MQAAVLEDVTKLAVRTLPDPAPAPNEVVLGVRAVGVCGTDLHIYQGHGNYCFDDNGRPIPLRVHPQILGHEFAGEVLAVGREVKDLKAGDRVLADQGRNCHSQQRSPICAYCASGDSHQCAYYQEHGITGLQGALANFIAVPAVNCIKLDDAMSWETGALVEPLGCVVHSSDRVERAEARYRFGGPEPIRNVLIVGAGPAGLLFLQYLRQVKRFDGLIMISDVREKNLVFARQFGGTSINVSRQDLIAAVKELTHGEMVHYLIESSGNSVIFEQMPGLLRKQATVMLYGHGHKGRDIGLLCLTMFLEPTFVVGIGASGGFDKDLRPTTYRVAKELVSAGKIQVLPYVTHRYGALGEIHRAFEQDFSRAEYIKGILTLG